MSQLFDRFAVAARIRALLALQDAAAISRTATRMGVSELALLMTIDERDPMPVMDVLVAIIEHYGVDPAWLVTGEYDSTVHRMALEDDTAIVGLIMSSTGASAAPAAVSPAISSATSSTTSSNTSSGTSSGPRSIAPVPTLAPGAEPLSDVREHRTA